MIWVLAAISVAASVAALYFAQRCLQVTDRCLLLSGEVARLTAEVARLRVPQGGDVHAVMNRAVADAPNLFARAREAERLRLVIACVECGDPTMIVCDTCDRRVCVAHREAHACRGSA